MKMRFLNIIAVAAIMATAAMFSANVVADQQGKEDNTMVNDGDDALFHIVENGYYGFVDRTGKEPQFIILSTLAKDWQQ